MRALLVAVAVVVAACSPPIQQPDEPERDAGVEPIAQTWAARGETNPSVYVFTDLDDRGVANGPLSLQFAINAEFPQLIDVKPNFPAYVRRGCENGTKWGTERFTSISEVTGDAATLSIVDGQLHVELKHHGSFEARVDGVITGSDCRFGGTELINVPTSHKVDVRVVEIAGFEVTHFEQLAGCANKVIVAAGQPIQLPVAHALDVRDERLAPLNAPRPVKLTLRGEGDVFADPVRLSAGRTAIELDTALPVRGLDAIYAVPSSSVTAAEIELGIVLTYIKGPQWADLADGALFRVPYPDDANNVAVRSNRIETTEGTLCSQPPSDWFFATSQTPSTCAPTPGESESSYGSSVVKLVEPGECRATIGIRGTNLTWSTRFTASF